MVRKGRKRINPFKMRKKSPPFCAQSLLLLRVSSRKILEKELRTAGRTPTESRGKRKLLKKERKRLSLKRGRNLQKERPQIVARRTGRNA